MGWTRIRRFHTWRDRRLLRRVNTARTRVGPEWNLLSSYRACRYPPSRRSPADHGRAGGSGMSDTEVTEATEASEAAEATRHSGLGVIRSQDEWQPRRRRSPFLQEGVDCLIDLAHCISLDFFDRPQLYRDVGADVVRDLTEPARALRVPGGGPLSRAAAPDPHRHLRRRRRRIGRRQLLRAARHSSSRRWRRSSSASSTPPSRCSGQRWGSCMSTSRFTSRA